MLSEKLLAKKSVAVIGDYFLDEFIHIDSSKSTQSLYANGPAHFVTKVERFPGAAGTVAKNLKNFGIGNVFAVGFVGDDGNGHDLVHELRKRGINTAHLITTSHRITPAYRMVLLDGKETEEFDILNNSPTPSLVEQAIVKAIKDLVNQERLDAIIVLDQLDDSNNGVVTKGVRDFLREYIGDTLLSDSEEKQPPVFFDSRNNVGSIRGAITKCNRNEFCRSCLYSENNGFIGSLISASKEGNIIIATADKDGAYIAADGEILNIPAIETNGPIDTRGAGDAFTSGLICASLCDESVASAMKYGIAASSLCISQIGTTGYMTFDQLENRVKEVSICDYH